MKNVNKRKQKVALYICKNVAEVLRNTYFHRRYVNVHAHFYFVQIVVTADKSHTYVM